jgi:broad specificity phosphatase PhoE
LGKRQLDASVAALKGIKFEAVYSSDLSRAIYGAEALAKSAGVTLRISSEWREMNFGECEGLSFSEMKERYPELAKRVMAPGGSEPIQFPEGESDRTFMARIARALARLTETHPYGSVCLVSHSGVGRAVLSEFLQLPAKNMWVIDQDYAHLHVVDVYPSGSYVIRLLNGYLGPEGYHQKGPGYESLRED